MAFNAATPDDPAWRAAQGLSLRHLVYFARLAQALNFTRAAALCHVTQSTLSAGMAALEEQIGAPLFERDRRSVRLTGLGAALLPRAHALLAAAGDLVQSGQAASQPLQGSLTLGAIPTIAPFLLPTLLRAMRSDLPAIMALLREETTDSLLEGVASGRLDTALIALPMDTGRLQVLPLFEEELWLVAAEGDPVAAQPQARLSRLDPGRLLLLGEGHCLREHSLQACQHGRRGTPAVPSTIEASSLATLVQMVEAGLGVSLLPEMAVRSGLLVGSRVVARPLQAPPPRREIALVARPQSPRKELLDRIQALARGVLQGAGKPAGARRNRVGVARPAS
jgi:LysR family hydrogen peroxide-inducible transcriptional activator